MLIAVLVHNFVRQKNQNELKFSFWSRCRERLKKCKSEKSALHPLPARSFKQECPKLWWQVMLHESLRRWLALTVHRLFQYNATGAGGKPSTWSPPEGFVEHQSTSEICIKLTPPGKPSTWFPGESAQSSAFCVSVTWFLENSLSAMCSSVCYVLHMMKIWS